MANKEFDNVTLNIKWKKNDETIKPPIWPDTGQDDNGYLNTRLSDTLGLITRHLDELHDVAFKEKSWLIRNDDNVAANRAVMSYVERTAILSGDTLYINGPIVRYGIKIARNDSNPDTRVQYMYDCVGFTPAHMVYNSTNPERSYFSYGSWANAFFVKHNYPCMCRYDGIEDYRLDPNNHFLKEDGTRSDVDNLSYAGNAQSCFNCHIWIKRWMDDDYEYYAVSNVKYDDDYYDYPYIRANGSVADKLYYPMYKGSLDSSNRLRSMSSPEQIYAYELAPDFGDEEPIGYPTGYYIDDQGTPAPETYTPHMVLYELVDNGVYPQNYTNVNTELTACNKNGAKWQIGDWAHREWLNVLLLLISKNDNTQKSFGQGCTSGGADNASIHYGFPKNGSLNMKGQFYGYTGTTNAMKVFFIENWWGTRWDRCLGLINYYGTIWAKWTPPYSTSSVSGYINTGMTLPDSPPNYMKKTSNTYGRLPVSIGGSATTYTCDGVYFRRFHSLALCGGNAIRGVLCGAWFVALYDAIMYTGWSVGSSPYLK